MSGTSVLGSLHSFAPISYKFSGNAGCPVSQLSRSGVSGNLDSLWYEQPGASEADGDDVGFARLAQSGPEVVTCTRSIWQVWYQ